MVRSGDPVVTDEGTLAPVCFDDEVKAEAALVAVEAVKVQVVVAAAPCVYSDSRNVRLINMRPTRLFLQEDERQDSSAEPSPFLDGEKHKWHRPSMRADSTSSPRAPSSSPARAGLSGMLHRTSSESSLKCAVLDLPQKSRLGMMPRTSSPRRETTFPGLGRRLTTDLLSTDQAGHVPWDLTLSTSSGSPQLRKPRTSVFSRAEREKKSKEDARLLSKLVRSARFVPLIALSHAAESTVISPTESVVEAVVIFADVSGYTALAEMCNSGAGGAGGEQGANLVGSTSTGLAGAERMRDALNEYLGNMIDMLTGHGADIVKFAGDAMMAVWQVDKTATGMGTGTGTGAGPGHAAADTAALAVAVCLEMGAALDEYTCQGLPKGCTLRLHTAIGYGPLSLVVVGGIDGHWLQLPVGDPIAQVAPILDAAPPGSLVVSLETHELLRDTFVCQPLTKVATVAAGEKKEEVIGMQVLRRSDDFPDHIASYIDAGFDEISDAMHKKAERRDSVSLSTRRNSCFEFMPESVLHQLQALADGPSSPNPNTRLGGFGSPGEHRGSSISSGKTYRQRVMDIFNAAREKSHVVHNMTTRAGRLAAKAAALEEKTHGPLVTQAHYDAVLSFIPLPCRVALTESITELRRVTVMFITLDNPAALLGAKENKRNRRDSNGRKSRRQSGSGPYTTHMRGSNSSTSNSSVQLRLLQHLASTMQREVTRHDGFVKELTMDDKGLVMVVGFGVPPCCRWAQDPVLCACEAALAIRSALKAYGHRCGIGLTTGEVFCGTIGNTSRSEYSMIGSVVNLAARLMGAAAKLDKGIFIDKATKKVAVRDGLMECKFYDDINVKGKMEKVPVWRLKNSCLKLDSRGSFDAEEDERDFLLNTMMTTAGAGRMSTSVVNSPDGQAMKAIQKNRRGSSVYDMGDLDEGGGGRSSVLEMVGREQEMSDIREVLEAAVADGIKDSKKKKRGKRGGGGMLSALFGSCLGGVYQGADGGSFKNGKPVKSGKLVLIEGEAGIGKTCLLGAVERSARDETGFLSFRTNFATRQQVNFGWWYILRQMQLVLGDKLHTLLTFSQRSRLSLLREVGDMMPEMGKEMGNMGERGIEIQKELIHALLLLMDVITTCAGVPGIVLILDDTANLDAAGIDVVRHLLQPPLGTYPFTEKPFFPKVRNLVVVMAMRPVPHSSSTFTSLRSVADTRIMLSGLSRDQLCGELLKSKELRKRGVDRIGHTALCFLHERSSGNCRQALAWMAELLDDEDSYSLMSNGTSRQSSQTGEFVETPPDEVDTVPRSRPSLVVIQGWMENFSNAMHLPHKVGGSGGSWSRRNHDGNPLGPVISGRRFDPSSSDYYHDTEGGGAQLALDTWQTMQACVRIPMDVRAIYTAVNDSLSQSEILCLRVCSVLGEITPETFHYAQPGGVADFIQSARGMGDTLAEGWRRETERANEEIGSSEEVLVDGKGLLDLKKTLKTLVARGFLVLRTRGKVCSSLKTRVPGITSYDSLDGTTAVLSDFVTQMRDTHPMLEGQDFLFDTDVSKVVEDEDEPQTRASRGNSGDVEEHDEVADELLTFASFVHQEVTYQGWGLDHRRKVHERMSDAATEIIKDLQGRMAEPEASFGGEAWGAAELGNDQRLLAATHTWRVHHTMMAGDFQAAKEAWKAANEDVGKDVVRSLCRQKVP